MPWSSQAVIAETVIVEGPSGGIFTYDASGNLRTANVSQTTTDPNQGITCYAGFNTFNGHGAVISLFSSTLDVQLWYSDLGSSTQGPLVASVGSGSGTDPFGNAYVGGGPISYGSSTNGELIGSTLQFESTAAGTRIITGSVIDLGDALTDAAQPELFMTAPLTSSNAAAQMALFGESKDGTKPAQAVLAAVTPVPATSALCEIQGTTTAGRIDVSPSATAPPARPAGVEPWNTLTSLTYQNSWADSGTNIPGRYRLVASPPATVEIEGDLTVGTVADGTLIVTLPAAYRPTHSQIIRLVVPAGTPTNPGNMRLTVGTDGTIKCTSLAGLASPNRIYFHDFISLD